MTEFIEYVKSLHSLLASVGPDSKLHVTVGNESCDLDSMVTALSHAHYSGVTNGDVVSLPLFDCKRADFDLRTEATELLAQIGVQSEWLIFSEDLPEAVLSSAGHLEVTLVDHNTTSNGLLADAVVQVIDHHELALGSRVGRDGVSSIVERVGSCSTLVAKQLLTDHAYSLSGPVATLLLSAILLDTGNLQSEGVVTEKDREVAAELKTFLPDTFDSDTHFNDLLIKRFDISKLSTPQVLGRDFKKIRVADKFAIGFSSVTSNLLEFISREGFNAHVATFHQSESLDLLLLLGIHYRGQDLSDRKREIVVSQSEGGTAESELAESVVSMLEANEDLQCSRRSEVELEGVLLEQANTTLSRKYILPLVCKFVTDVEKGHPMPQETVLQPLEPVVSMTTAKGGAPIPEYSIGEEMEDIRTHRLVSLAGEKHVIDMTLIEPYKNIVKHAGYVGDNRMAVMVVSAVYLPPRTLHNYKEVALQLFYYIMSVLDRIVVDEYMIVYLHSGAPPKSRPSLQLLRKFYELVDRRFRKQLMHLYIVHPTFFVKSILTLARPFISSKFWRKVHFVPILAELPRHIVIDDSLLPPAVKSADSAVTRHQPPSIRYSPSGDK